MEDRIVYEETREVLAEFMELLKSDISTWQESDMSEHIKIWRREYNPNTTLCLRMECLFPDVPPEIAYEVLADIRLRSQWDSRLEKNTIVEETKDFQI